MRPLANQDTGQHPFRILHIGPSLCDGTGGDSVTVGLRLLNNSLAHQPDVYRGLAWLAKTYQYEPISSNPQTPPQKSTPLIGVIVCVDELTVAAYEFFELAKSYDYLLGVYAYSTFGDTGSVQRAIAHGATGELTDEVLAMLQVEIDGASKSAPTDETETSILEQPEPEVAKDENHLDDITKTNEHVATTKAVVDITEDEYFEDEEDEDDLIGPVQVPWDRRPAPPQRSAPPPHTTKRERPTTTPSPTPEVVNKDRAQGNNDSKKYSAKPKHQPLLTPEELQALIGKIDYNAPLDDPASDDHESV